MMMEDNEIGRVIINGGDDNDSIIGGQTIASLMNDGNAISMSDISKNVDAKESETVEIISQSNNANTMAIVGYDDGDSIATDTVNEVNEKKGKSYGPVCRNKQPEGAPAQQVEFELEAIKKGGPQRLEGDR